MNESTIANFERYRSNPWAFLSECIYTQDSVDDENPYKPFPSQWEYLRLFTLVWQKEKMIAIPKSRRMTMSWTCLAMILWECIFHRGKQWAVVSKKEDDSAELVNRIYGMYTRIPSSKIPKALLPKIRNGKMTKSPPRLAFDFGDEIYSEIAGFPMGADQLRQFTFSGIFGDEAAFWDVAEEFYTGAKPTTDGGGRMVLVSSRSPGFFKKIVFDQINNKSSNFPETPPALVKRPMQGIEIWKNPKNKFLIMDIHYTANPDKRAPEFRQALREALPLHQFLREYERNWQTFTGMPVYPNFRADIHCPENKPEAHLGLPLLFGWDFGLTPACIVGQLQGNSLKVLREFTSQNEGIKTFAPKVMNTVKQLWPEWRDARKDHFHFIDPAGFQRVATDTTTCAQEMETSAGIINIAPGAKGNNEWESRRAGVEGFLLHIEKDSAGLEIDESECPLIVEGFRGAYRYADSINDIEPDKVRPIKNAWSHPHDGLQYLAGGASQQKTTQIIDIPRPQYSFMKSAGNSSRRDDYGRKL